MNTNNKKQKVILKSARGTIIIVPRGQLDDFGLDLFMLNILQGKLAYRESDRTLVFTVPGLFSPVADVICGGEHFDRQVWTKQLMDDQPDVAP